MSRTISRDLRWLARLAARVPIALHRRPATALGRKEGQPSHSVAIANLGANQRSRLGLAVLTMVVLGLGDAGLAVVTRRRGSDRSQADKALLGEEVGERRAAQEAGRASDGRFRSLVERASDLTVVTDESGVIGYVSSAVEALLGYRPEDLLKVPLINQVEADERANVAQAMAFLVEHPGMMHTIELRLRTRDGHVRLVEAVCQNLAEDPDVGGLLWNGRDVTDRRAREDELTRQALHDPLTGLPNRTLLLDRLTQALSSEPGSGGSVSVILANLDGFKDVNDALGQPAGDELLRFAAQRLLGCVREGDMTARVGSDEFAVLMGHSRHAVAVGQRIADVLSRPFTVAGEEVRVSASIGVAHSHGSESATGLLRDADIAMSVAKKSGVGRVEVFEPDMQVRASRRISLQQQLARAVDLGEIEVHYQPIIDLKTTRATMLEALARWRRPDRSLVAADVFIPIAEETGLIVEIGRDVLRQACHAVQLWRRTVAGHGDLGVSVNVSVHQVLSGRLVEHVAEALKDSGLPPAALTLEITESTALEDPDRVAAEFALLRRLGVRIAVDDFGSGYSSLGLLMKLTVDVLKIDSTLLDFDTMWQGSLVTAVAELGRTLGLSVVVEGVETLDHLAQAFAAECDAAQGYHFSRPLAFEDVPGFFEGWSDRE
jgi:diguanylate cyclase (GGDEF)-like protein/PAS domain S-box-containing protein